MAKVQEKIEPLHPLKWMAGQVVAGGREIDPESIVFKAEKILNQCDALLQQRLDEQAKAEAMTPVAEPAAESAAA